MTRAALLGLLTLFALLPTAAQDGGDHEARVRRYLEVSGTLRQCVDRMRGESVRYAMERRYGPEVSEALRDAADVEQLVQQLLPLYRKWDDGMLDAAIEFYSSAEGQKLVKAQARVDSRVRDRTDAWIRKSQQAALLDPQAPPVLKRAQVQAREAAAVSTLKTIVTAQSLFRESDKDRNGDFDYADGLAPLIETKLLTAELEDGIRNGYRFEVHVGSKSTEFYWIARATPLDPDAGGRVFVVNQSGIVHYAREPFELDTVTCKLPKEVIPVGR